MPISDPYPLHWFYQESWKNSSRTFSQPLLYLPTTHLKFQRSVRLLTHWPTTAALIFILHTVTWLLTTQPYVVVIALDFSKAFDNVRHSTILNKMADLDTPDDVYNWLVSYFSGHSHCTRYGGESSAVLEISSGIIQGSASYIVNSSDLAALTPGNFHL